MLPDPDVRAVIRLLGTASTMEGDLSQKKRHLLTELCGLIDGDNWFWSFDRGAKRTPVGMSGGRSLLVSLLPSSPLNSGSASPTGDSVWDPKAKSRRTVTVRQISENRVSSISIVRQAGRRPFDAREIKIAQIILSEIPWLHEPNSSTEVRQIKISLAPRQRATFVHLIDGLSRQAIAERLRISPHTVHGYIKDIYKHYRVNSRAELMKRFTLGSQERSDS